MPGALRPSERSHWPQGVTCPHCHSPQVTKPGRDKSQPARQKYERTVCRKRFDDLTGTIFAGHHQPLRVWMLCLYFMGLNLSNEQITHKLDLNSDDIQKMTTQLHESDKVSGTDFGHIDGRKSFSLPDTFSVARRFQVEEGPRGDADHQALREINGHSRDSPRGASPALMHPAQSSHLSTVTMATMHTFCFEGKSRFTIPRTIRPAMPRRRRSGCGSARGCAAILRACRCR